jgi:hypothetical protein
LQACPACRQTVRPPILAIAQPPDDRDDAPEQDQTKPLQSSTEVAATRRSERSLAGDVTLES